MITAEHDPRPVPPATPGRGHGLGWIARPGRLSRAGRVAYVGVLVAVLVAVALSVTVAAAPARNAPAPPRLAHGFSLPRLGHTGQTVSLAAYAGRPLIVNFFASWCAPCQRETPMLARFFASERGRVIIVGIDANDQMAAALRFLGKAGVTYPVGFDPFPSPVTTSYGVYALPQTFFLNSAHHIVAKVMGPVTEKDLTRDAALMNRHA